MEAASGSDSYSLSVAYTVSNLELRGNFLLDLVKVYIQLFVKDSHLASVLSRL